MDNNTVAIGRTGNQLVRGILTPAEAMTKVIADINVTGAADREEMVSMDAFTIQTILIHAVGRLMDLEQILSLERALHSTEEGR